MKSTHIHVHLFYGADPTQFRKDEDVGVLYGYHHAKSEHVALSYCEDHAENVISRFVRRSIKAVVGFDFIHTFRNRAALLNADVVWTHTEREYLAVALLLMLKGRSKAPLLVAQSVWLLDLWPTLSLPKQLLYKTLLARANALTTLSTVNAALAIRYWGREATVLLYGISADDFPLTPATEWKPHQPVSVVGIGNDRDRDWDTLVDAFQNDHNYSVRVATRRSIRHSVGANVSVHAIHGLAAQRAIYDWADIVVVPLRPNHHASGITVVLEAVTMGKPVVATAGGGLEDYFSPDAIYYVPSHDADALRDAVASLVRQPAATLAMVHRAQQEFLDKDLTARAFAAQHIDLTRELLAESTRAGSHHLPSRA